MDPGARKEKAGSVAAGFWVKWVQAAAFWTLIGLAFASQLFVSSAKLGQPVSWARAVSWSLGDWYVYAALAFLSAPLARRIRFTSTGWAKALGVHFPASLVFSVLYMTLRALVGQAQAEWSGHQISYQETFDLLLTKTFLFNVLVYWVLVISVHAMAYYRESVERERHASELERRLVVAHLKALQMQLNPHFLFNTLHAISALMHQNVEAADRMIARLSELLRYALESTDEQVVPLRQEIEFLDRYLEIEQVRFGSRLQVVKHIAPETIDALVPNLVLQPLVENAIQHGIAPHARVGRLEIIAMARDQTLILEVCDNGSGLTPGSSAQEGIGLSNTRSRLVELYGDNQTFELKSGPQGGFRAIVSIPFQRMDRGTGKS